MCTHSCCRTRERKMLKDYHEEFLLNNGILDIEYHDIGTLFNILEIMIHLDILYRKMIILQQLPILIMK
jgi:hypothetical protein